MRLAAAHGLQATMQASMYCLIRGAETGEQNMQQFCIGACCRCLYVQKGEASRQRLTGAPPGTAPPPAPAGSAPPLHLTGGADWGWVSNNRASVPGTQAGARAESQDRD